MAEPDLGLGGEDFRKGEWGIPGEGNMQEGSWSGPGAGSGHHHSFGEKAEQEEVEWVSG